MCLLFSGCACCFLVVKFVVFWYRFGILWAVLLRCRIWGWYKTNSSEFRRFLGFTLCFELCGFVDFGILRVLVGLLDLGYFAWFFWYFVDFGYFI